MIRSLMTAATVAALALGAPAIAGGKPQHAGKPGNPSTGHCPPGLAKKNPPCVPPGLARKGVGDRLGPGYPRYTDNRHRLPRLKEGEAWYHDGTFVYRVDNETRRVIELIRLIDLVANG